MTGIEVAGGPDAPHPSEAPGDPRIQRTRAAVLAVVRALVVEQGPSALTFSAISKRSGVTRQTLYRHWPSRQALFADLVITSHVDEYPAAGEDPRALVTAFLETLRAGIREPVLKAALVALAGEADSDAESATALIGIFESRRDTLNELLRSTGWRVADEDFAGLCGPVFFERLFRNRDADDAVIARAVDAWAARGPLTRR